MLPNLNEEEEHDLLIDNLMDALNTQHQIYLHGSSQNQAEENQIEELIERTLTLSESNSALIVGQRGCGKSFILHSVMKKLEKKQLLQQGIIVSLSGLLETNDCIALKAITQQLNVDEELTCTSGSFAENLQNVLKALQAGNKDLSKPVIFILEEFDLFCHHKNQTLLYNLFDIAQSAQAPICVLGVTCRLDAIELLEKRVKSRFSHRQIFIFSHESFEDYLNLAKNIVRAKEGLAEISSRVVKAWNLSVNKVFDDSEVKHLLKKKFCLSRSIRSLISFMRRVLCEVKKEEVTLRPQHIKKASQSQSEDNKINMLEGLSVLQLCLMISMKHLDSIYDGEPFNFEMVYNQYRKVGERNSSLSSFQRRVVLKAFDQLMSFELIRPLDNSRSYTQREYRLMHLMVQPRQIETALTQIPNLPIFLKHWSDNVV